MTDPPGPDLDVLAREANRLTLGLRQIGELQLNTRAARHLRRALDRLCAEAERLLGISASNPGRKPQ